MAKQTFFGGIQNDDRADKDLFFGGIQTEANEAAAGGGDGVVWHLSGDRGNATLAAPTTHRLKDLS